MPCGDGTGPFGLGPKTGRRAGFCAGYNTPGYANPVVGFGRRWFWRRRAWQPQSHVPVQSSETPVQYSPKEELEELKAEKEALERDLKAVEQRIKELEEQK